jgi:UDP-N-acetylglucosamine--N-acetylmuramyl-(pentapeptide) pyrophosphoryl-undecaprenol N-acetylglucosamine transferase
VLDELKTNPANNILFIGTQNVLERELVESRGIKYAAVKAGKFRRYNRGMVREALDVKTQFSNAADASRSLQGYLAARRLISRFKPDLALVKGGNVGYPVGLAAAHLHVPLILHESDFEMGKGNRMLLKQAVVVGVGFPTKFYRGLSDSVRAKLQYVGNPVRSEVIAKQTKTEHKALKPTILVIGGSQGAHFINEFIFDNLNSLLEGYRLLHIAGKQDVELARVYRSRLTPENQPGYEVFGFVGASQLVHLYEQADLAITRPGVNTIVELAANGIVPLIIAPVSNRHQWQNAQTLEKLGAARVFRQEEISLVAVRASIDRILDRPTERKHLLQHLSKLYQPQSAHIIVQLIERIVENGKPA